MCGIAGFIVKDGNRELDREKLLDELLEGIDHRGGDATGFVARNREGIVEWHKASCDARGFIPYRRRLPAAADVVIGHTRFATNGHHAFPENNHPVKRGPIYVTHNGVIFNDREIFAATKRTPYGQVDSEAIAALLAAHGSLGAHCGKSFADVDGSAAIAAMDERDGTVLLARISSSPLFVLHTRRLVIWASTAAAAEGAHRAAVGSLGRAKAKPMAEGDAILYRDGKGSTFTFSPPSWSYKPLTYKSKTLASDTSGSYLPAAAPSYLRSKAAEECEICGQDMPDAFDLWDSDDVYEVCESCWHTYSDDHSRNASLYSERLAYEAKGER